MKRAVRRFEDIAGQGVLCDMIVHARTDAYDRQGLYGRGGAWPCLRPATLLLGGFALCPRCESKHSDRIRLWVGEDVSLREALGITRRIPKHYRIGRGRLKLDIRAGEPGTLPWYQSGGEA